MNLIIFVILVKEIIVKEDNRAWDEKLDDFEGEFEFVEQENEDGEKGLLRNRNFPFFLICINIFQVTFNRGH